MGKIKIGSGGIQGTVGGDSEAGSLREGQGHKGGQMVWAETDGGGRLRRQYMGWWGRW